MNPYDTWLQQSRELGAVLDRTFETHIDKVEDPELRRDIEMLYREAGGGRYDRFVAVTALLALKLHFFEDA